jgi:hypothetical protein
MPAAHKPSKSVRGISDGLVILCSTAWTLPDLVFQHNLQNGRVPRLDVASPQASKHYSPPK